MRKILYVLFPTALALASSLWSVDAAAGTLLLSEPALADDVITLPVSLEGEVANGVAALNFSFSYDPSVWEPVGVEVGEAAEIAGKQVQGSLSSDGSYVVLMMGMNQSVVTSGPVVDVLLRKIGDPSGNRTEFAISDTTLASVDAMEIPSSGSTAYLEFSEEEGDDDGQGSEDDDPNRVDPEEGGGSGADDSGDDEGSDSSTSDDGAGAPITENTGSSASSSRESGTRSPARAGTALASGTVSGGSAQGGVPNVNLGQFRNLSSRIANRRAAIPTPAVAGGGRHTRPSDVQRGTETPEDAPTRTASVQPAEPAPPTPRTGKSEPLPPGPRRETLEPEDSHVPGQAPAPEGDTSSTKPLLGEYAPAVFGVGVLVLAAGILVARKRLFS